jgi:hypothetical protein
MAKPDIGLKKPWPRSRCTPEGQGVWVDDILDFAARPRACA